MAVRGRFYAVSAFGSGIYSSWSGRYWRHHFKPVASGQAIALLRDGSRIQAVYEKATYGLKQNRWVKQADGYLLARGPQKVGINCAIGIIEKGGVVTGSVPRFYSEPMRHNGEVFYATSSCGIGASQTRYRETGCIFLHMAGSTFFPIPPLCGFSQRQWDKCCSNRYEG